LFLEGFFGSPELLDLILQSPLNLPMLAFQLSNGIGFRLFVLLPALQVLLLQSFPLHLIVVLELDQRKLDVPLLLLCGLRVLCPQEFNFCFESLPAIL
jgi:hypothetical protein